jgi:hypothetical protein
MQGVLHTLEVAVKRQCKRFNSTKMDYNPAPTRFLEVTRSAIN